MNYHTHVWVSLTDSAGNFKDAGPLTFLAVSESCSIGGDHSAHLTFSGRSATGLPWRSIIAVGDLVSIGALRTEENGESVARILMEDGIVSDVQVSESMSQGGYQLITSVSITGLQSVLQADAVGWWMYYGTQVGVLRARGELMVDDLGGQLDKVLANYMNKVVFHRDNWRRADVGLKERLGYHFRTLKPNVPYLENLSVAEGTHWDLLAGHAELNIHEMLVQHRTAQGSGQSMTGDHKNIPTHTSKAIVSSPDAGQADKARPYIIIRPKPFPYADKNGKPKMDEWNALPLHDLSNDRATTGQHGFSHGMSGVTNFTMVFPGYDSMNEQMAFTTGIAVMNQASINRYGYRPAKFKTNLILKDGNEQNMIDLARELTWRVAAQMNRADEMANGSITVPLSPEIQPGDRVKFRLIHTDGTDAGVFQGYVQSRSHSYQVGSGGLTTLALSRVLPQSIYEDPEWFVQGLEVVEIESQSPQHDAPPPAVEDKINNPPLPEGGNAGDPPAPAPVTPPAVEDKINNPPEPT